MSRYYTQKATTGSTAADGSVGGGGAEGDGDGEYERTFVLQSLDKSSPFVNTHPLQWVVNMVVMEYC